MVDNFDRIARILSFDSDDDFYFVQILQRKKDNPGGAFGSNNSSRLIKAYYITSVEKLNKQKEEMIFFANHFNARVGINLNKRSFYKTAFNTLKKIAEQMHNKDFYNIKSAYNTSCGIHNGNEDRIWLLDIDDAEISPIMIAYIEHECAPFAKFNNFPDFDSKILGIIPSKSGYHLITKPFDTRQFSVKYPEVSIHKNNPTNLYIP
jgi:hypothetical protein